MLRQHISHAFFFASRLFFHLCLDSRTVPTCGFYFPIMETLQHTLINS